MKRTLILAGLAVGSLALGGFAAGLPGASAMPAHGSAGTHAVHVCTTHPAPNHFACTAMALADANGHILTSTKVHPLVGFTAADVQKAYNLKGLKSHGATVAVVDAYGYSGLEADLAKFRKDNNLPACTSKSGCLTVLDQRGGTDYPPDNSGWDLEQALDVDMVSAACPDCKILVVQGDKPALRSLGSAENTAAAQKGVVAISNSYIGGQNHTNWQYNHPGIAITASSGDAGYSPDNLYPASDPHVIGVGGTSVTKDNSARGYSEKVWAGAGSGCSEKNNMPKYQQSVKTTCKTDAVADVSGPADPGNGGLLIVYGGSTHQVGGTSESSPMIAAVYALSGKTSGYPGRFPYSDTKDLYDVTSGSNGSCGSPLCDAGKGWDGPTGLGTPNGVKAF